MNKIAPYIPGLNYSPIECASIVGLTRKGRTKEEAKIAAFVALPAQERQSQRDSSCLIYLPLLGLVLFFFHPLIALLCLPITIVLAIAACCVTHAPSNAPSEEERFRAEILRRMK